LKKRRIVLIDYYNLFIRNWQVCPLTDENEEHFGAVVGSLNSIKSFIKKTNPTDVFVITDGENAALRRKMMMKEYKANRKKEWARGACRAYDFLNEQDQKDNWTFQKRRLDEYLSVLPIKTISIPYLEADDVIAQISNVMNNEETQIVIYSSDADYQQLINENVFCYNPITKKLLNEEKFFKKHGIPPYNYIYLKCIQGDASDNVTGIKGIGPKTLIKMVPEIVDTRIDSIQDFLEICQHAIDSGSKVYTKSMLNKFKLLIENESKLQLNYNIMQLSDVDISQQSKDLINRVIEEDVTPFSKTKLRAMFYNDGMYNNVKYLTDWSTMFSKLTLYGRNK